MAHGEATESRQQTMTRISPGVRKGSVPVLAQPIGNVGSVTRCRRAGSPHLSTTGPVRGRPGIRRRGDSVHLIKIRREWYGNAVSALPRTQWLVAVLFLENGENGPHTRWRV